MLSVFYETRPENLYVGTICHQPYPCHVHDVPEIICLKAGSVQMTIAGEEVSLGPGDIVSVFPSMPHSYDAISTDVSGLMLILTPDAIPEYNQIFRNMRPATPLLSARDVPEDLRHIVRRLEVISQDAESPLRLPYLHVFFAHLFMTINLQPVGKSMMSSMTSQVLHYVAGHFTEPLSLESTAKALGISRIHLSHIFSQQLKINFRQYVNSLRIEMACNLLRDPANTISQAAWKCGYCNLRTFHRAFLAQIGMPPNQWRRRILGDMPDDAGDTAADALLNEDPASDA